MNRTDVPELVPPATAAATFGLMAALVAIDLATDLRAGSSAVHVVLEATVVAIGLAASGAFALRVRRLVRDAQELRDQASELAASLRTSREEARRWRTEASLFIEGLGAAIDHQLERWDLSPAEREIALLLLKGLSHKEIAKARKVNETTVRQQARSLYRKAGLTGRSDLAAFFLEDLLGPPPAAAPDVALLAGGDRTDRRP